MKYTLLFSILLGVGVIGWFLRERPGGLESSVSFSSPSPTPQPTRFFDQALDKMLLLEVKGEPYRYAVITVIDPKKLNLLPNFDSRTVSSDLYKSSGCTALINGGFYTKEDKPLGLFISEGKQLSGAIESTLLDGFISFSPVSNQMIGLSRPLPSARWALQSGPLLIVDSRPTQLKIRNDEAARRSIAMVTESQHIILATITGSESLSYGPYLADLPEVAIALSSLLGEVVGTAINLDGGSASAFISPDLEILEQTWIGSYFCLQE